MEMWRPPPMPKPRRTEEMAAAAVSLRWGGEFRLAVSSRREGESDAGEGGGARGKRRGFVGLFIWAIIFLVGLKL